MELMSQDIKILLKKFQIDNVKDITKYEQAFTLLTKANKSNPFRKLAWLGDKVLAVIISRYLFNIFPELNEGDLTVKLRPYLKNTNMSLFAADMKFREYIISDASLDCINEHTLATFLESFLGVIYLDFGYMKAESFLLKFYVTWIDKNINDVAKNNLNKSTPNNIKKTIISVKTTPISNLKTIEIKNKIVPINNKINGIKNKEIDTNNKKQNIKIVKNFQPAKNSVIKKDNLVKQAPQKNVKPTVANKQIIVKKQNFNPINNNKNKQNIPKNNLSKQNTKIKTDFDLE